jgi:hypothetical protein
MMSGAISYDSQTMPFLTLTEFILMKKRTPFEKKSDD